MQLSISFYRDSIIGDQTNSNRTLLLTNRIQSTSGMSTYNH